MRGRVWKNEGCGGKPTSVRIVLKQPQQTGGDDIIIIGLSLQLVLCSDANSPGRRRRPPPACCSASSM